MERREVAVWSGIGRPSRAFGKRHLRFRKRHLLVVTGRDRHHAGEEAREQAAAAFLTDLK